MTLSSYKQDAFEAARWAKPKRTPRWRSLFTKKRIAIFFVVLILALGGWLGFKFAYNLSKIFKGNVFGVLTTTKLDGEDTGRVNILLAGNSADDPGHDGANLTDSIMVVSINTRNNTAYMLSVPRDLWVNIPGNGHAKINEAYADGQSENFKESGYPDGGMGLLEETIEQNFNVNINYYSLIDYGAFRDTVNAVGGINVTIKTDDPRGLYDPSIDWTTHGPLVKLTNGTHTLNGEQALDLARARGDAYGSYGFDNADFDRTQHQREMLLALKSKIMTTGVLANPVKISNLLDALGKNVKSDLELSEVRRLYQIGGKIDNSKITSVGLDNANGVNLLSNYTSPQGQSALIPAAGLDDFSDIQSYIHKLNSSDPVVQESAKVVVLNATETSGVAASNAKSLKARGMTIVTTADASADSATSQIIDLSAGKKPATKAVLEKLYGTNVTTTNSYAGIYDADFIIVVGADHAPASSSSTSTTTQD